MGPTKYGIGSTARSRFQAVTQSAPLTPESGSGGPGILRGMPGAIGNTARGVRFDLSPAVGEVQDVTTGRVTLGMVNLTVLLLIGFYYWTRTAQGGG